MADPKLSLPSPTFKVGSTEKELRMSYGMFSDIMRLIGTTEDLAVLLVTDSSTRDLVLRRLFTETKKSINGVDDLADSFDVDILPSEMDEILAWVADHASYFLVSTGKALSTVILKYQKEEPKSETPSLESSKTGSTD